jgi:hypothetical protein
VPSTPFLAAAACPDASALDRLRKVPPQDLSLVQMVERFAAALHEFQQRESAQPQAQGQNRDQALAEALRALTMFTEHGFAANAPAKQSGDELQDTTRELRDALAKLQTLRGAA